MTSPCRMHDSQELLPCAHCGGEAEFDHDDHGWQWIVCKNCGISTNCRVSCMDDCKPLLAEDWNRRTSRAERDAVIEALRGIDQTEIESPHGWWETSTGAKFGADVLQKVKNILGIQEKP